MHNIGILRQTRTRRLAVSLAVAGLAALGVRADVLVAPAAAAAPAGESSALGSKVDYIVEHQAAQVSSMQAKGFTDGAVTRKLDNDIVPVGADGSIEVSVWSVAPATEEQRADLAALGASVTDRVKSGRGTFVPSVGLLDAWVPADRIEDLAALAWVAAVTPVSNGVSDAGFGTIVSQGVTLHRANTVQDVRGINGNGVTVGVSSDGVSNIGTSQTNGELPTVTVDDAGSGDEGTAMLEIVADMAPQAGLVFDASNGLTDYVNSLNNLASKSNVVTEDLAFDNEPAFQEGLGARTADNIAANGVPVHSSAGNRAQDHVARVVATGTGTGPDGTSYTSTPSGCAHTPDNVVDIDPGAGTAFDMTLGNNNGNGTSFTLQWSEPRSIFPTVGQGGFTDLNLYVMNSALTQCLGQSVGVQANGTGDTIEQVVMPSGSAGTAVKLVVDVEGTSSAVTAPVIDLRWRNSGGNTDTPTAAGSLNPDSNYTGGAQAVAAVDAQNAGALENYSSAGPVRILTTTRCAGSAPCTGIAGAAEQDFNQPVWSAADDVSVSGVGGFGSPFTGTSAAAPSSAGCDALLRSAPGFSATSTPAATAARLIATATGTATVNVTGAGTLDCLAAVNRPPVAAPGGPYSTVEGQNITLNGSGSSDPDTGDSIASYAWDLDNNGTFETPGATPTFDAVGQDRVQTVQLKVTDQAGASTVASTTVTIANVAPTVTFTATSPVDENSPTTVTGTVTDPGWLDPLTATIDYGNPAGAQPLAGTYTSTPHGVAKLSFTVPHTYGDNGTFTITVAGFDDDTSSSTNHDVTVTNVNPTAAIDTSGGTVINGHLVLTGQEGVPVTLNGSSSDPGSDDLTFTWDFGDGSPSPPPHTSLVNPPATDPPLSPQIKPRVNVPDSVTHTFTACARTLTFISTDDDAGVSPPAHASIVIRGTSTKAEDAGWWKEELDLDHGHQDYSEAQVQCLLDAADLLSNVFSEARPASTLADGFEVLKAPPSVPDRVREMDKVLLAAWINFINGAIDLGDTVKDDQQLKTFSDVIVLAEAQRLDPSVPQKTLDRTRSLLDKFNHLRNHGNG